MGSKHIGHQVVAMMDRLGVPPLTRNYHLFYMCIANSNPVVRKAVRDLGTNPTQHELDQVISEFCPDAVDSQVVRRHENAVLRAIDDLALRMRSEQSEMSDFHNAVERVANALSHTVDQEMLTAQVLMKVAGAIEEAGRRRVASNHRTLQHLDGNQKEISLLRAELVKFRRLANTDPLTGLANRRSFDEKLAEMMGEVAQFSLILLDIDYFKRINDAYGHAFGDQALKAVSKAISGILPPGSFLARTGGEEFAVLTKAALLDASPIAERVRQTIEQLKMHCISEEVRITVSLGVANSCQAGTPNGLYEVADAALYRSKNAGRNRVTIYDPFQAGASGNRYRIYAE